MSRREKPVYAVLDVGGTSIKLGAVSGAEVTVSSPVPALAHASANTVIAQLQHAIDASVASARQLNDVSVSGVAIAFPGPFDLAGGRPLLRDLGKFDSIHGMHLRRELEVADLPLVFVRDSEAVAVGEARFGAGAAAHRVLTVALGTGFGSCLTDGAVPVPSVNGQDIEALHELDTADGRVDDVLSATGLAKELRVTAAELRPLLEKRPLAAGHLGPVSVFARRLGRFLATQAHLRADLIVIAGGVSGSFDLLRDAVASHVDVDVVPAQLGSAGPLLGASHLAFPEDPR